MNISNFTRKFRKEKARYKGNKKIKALEKEINDIENELVDNIEKVDLLE